MWAEQKGKISIPFPAAAEANCNIMAVITKERSQMQKYFCGASRPVHHIIATACNVIQNFYGKERKEEKEASFGT